MKGIGAGEGQPHVVRATVIIRIHYYYNNNGVPVLDDALHFLLGDQHKFGVLLTHDTPHAKRGGREGGREGSTIALRHAAATTEGKCTCTEKTRILPRVGSGSCGPANVVPTTMYISGSSSRLRAEGRRATAINNSPAARTQGRERESGTRMGAAYP